MIKIIDTLSNLTGTILYYLFSKRRKIASYNISIILPSISEKEKKKLLKIASFS